VNSDDAVHNCPSGWAKEFTMNEAIKSLLIALTTRFSGSEFEMQYAPKECAIKKGRSAADKAEIATKWGERLPISKIKLGVSKGKLGPYEQKVNGQRLMEDKVDDFVPLAPKGKVWVGGNIFVNEAGDTIYIGYEPMVAEVTTIFTDCKGKTLTEEEKKEILTSADLPKPPSEGRQEVEEVVLWVTVKTDSLSWVKIGGKVVAL
jgi:hypothetical protein